MENRRVMPELYKDRVVRTPSPEENAKVNEAIKRRKKFDEGKAKAQGAYKQTLKEGAMKRSYTADEITTAQLLKGNPYAQEILDELNKGKKKNESGEEFQDGSEDSIGGEGHAAVARPDSIKHEGRPSGVGPDEPGTGTKKASMEDGDLEKSEDEDESKDKKKDNRTYSDADGGDDEGKKSVDGDLEKAIQVVGDFLMEKGYNLDETNEIINEYFGLEKSDNLSDNLPEEFEEGMVGAEGEDDDGDVLVDKKAKKSLTADETTLSHLLKAMGTERMEDAIKAIIGGSKVDYTKPYKEATAGLRASTQKRLAGSSVQDVDKKNEKPRLTNLARDPGPTFGGSETAGKSEDVEFEKSEENMDEEYSLDFSGDVLKAMGLEKGATSVSKEAGGGKATQINYGSKPTTKFKHPKAKADKKYIHSPAKGTVNVEKEGEKTRSIGVSEESKLKNASVSSADLYKSLDAILEKKTLAKDLRAGYKKESIKQTGEDYDHKAEADYKQAKLVRDKNPGIKPAEGSEKAFEHTTKEMSLRDKLAPKSSSVDLYKSLDAILEKGRKRESDRSAPKRVEESEGEGVELPGGSMATMGNPGGSKEKASFERAEPGTIKNLKKLAESPNKMDRKAAEAGMKRH